MVGSGLEPGAEFDNGRRLRLRPAVGVDQCREEPVRVFSRLWRSRESTEHLASRVQGFVSVHSVQKIDSAAIGQAPFHQAEHQADGPFKRSVGVPLCYFAFAASHAAKNAAISAWKLARVDASSRARSSTMPASSTPP
jgi:hypothetical protein